MERRDGISNGLAHPLDAPTRAARGDPMTTRQPIGAYLIPPRYVCRQWIDWGHLARVLLAREAAR